MGTLAPGKQYIYEKADGVTYRREFGSQERTVIGWDESFEDMQEDKIWIEIRRAAKHNPELRELLDKARMFYELSKQK
jgi:hypothetical protein